MPSTRAGGLQAWIKQEPGTQAEPRLQVDSTTNAASTAEPKGKRDRFVHHRAMISRIVTSPWEVCLGNYTAGFVAVRSALGGGGVNGAGQCAATPAGEVVSRGKASAASERSGVKVEPAECDGTAGDIPPNATVILFVNIDASPTTRPDLKNLTFDWKVQPESAAARRLMSIAGHSGRGGKVFVAVRWSRGKPFRVLGAVDRISNFQSGKFLVEDGSHVLKERDTARHHREITYNCLSKALRTGVGLVALQYPLPPGAKPKWCKNCCYRSPSATLHFKAFRTRGLTSFQNAPAGNPNLRRQVPHTKKAMRVPLPKGLPAGWKYVLRKVDNIPGRFYARFCSHDGRHRDVRTAEKVIRIDSNQHGYDAEAAIRRYRNLQASLRSSRSAEQRRMREEAIEFFRAAHGKLNGPMVHAFLGWTTKWDFVPNKDQVYVRFIDPKGQQWTEVEDIEAWLGQKMKSGEDVSKLVQAGSANADAVSFARGASNARSVGGSSTLDGATAPCKPEAKKPSGSLRKPDSSKDPRQELVEKFRGAHGELTGPLVHAFPGWTTKWDFSSTEEQVRVTYVDPFGGVHANLMDVEAALGTKMLAGQDLSTLVSVGRANADAASFAQGANTCRSTRTTFASLAPAYRDGEREAKRRKTVKREDSGNDVSVVTLDASSPEHVKHEPASLKQEPAANADAASPVHAKQTFVDDFGDMKTPPPRLNREQRDEAVAKFRARLGRLSGPTVGAFPGWTTKWYFRPGTDRVVTVFTDAKGKEWRNLIDLEAWFGSRMMNGEDVSAIVQDARSNANPTLFQECSQKARATEKLVTYVCNREAEKCHEYDKTDNESQESEAKTPVKISVKKQPVKREPTSEEPAEKFRKTHGALSGPIVHAFPGWTTRWQPQQDGTEVDVTHTDPKGIEWNVLKDLETYLGKQMEDGKDIGGLITAALAEADVGLFDQYTNEARVGKRCVVSTTPAGRDLLADGAAETRMDARDRATEDAGDAAESDCASHEVPADVQLVAGPTVACPAFGFDWRRGDREQCVMEFQRTFGKLSGSIAQALPGWSIKWAYLNGSDQVRVTYLDEHGVQWYLLKDVEAWFGCRMLAGEDLTSFVNIAQVNADPADFAHCSAVCRVRQITYITGRMADCESFPKFTRADAPSALEPKDVKVPLKEESKKLVKEDSKKPVKEDSKKPVKEEPKKPVKEETRKPVKEEVEADPKDASKELHAVSGAGAKMASTLQENAEEDLTVAAPKKNVWRKEEKEEFKDCLATSFRERFGRLSGPVVQAFPGWTSQWYYLPNCDQVRVIYTCPSNLRWYSLKEIEAHLMKRIYDGEEEQVIAIVQDGQQNADVISFAQSSATARKTKGTFMYKRTGPGPDDFEEYLYPPEGGPDVMPSTMEQAPQATPSPTPAAPSPTQPAQTQLAPAAGPAAKRQLPNSGEAKRELPDSKEAKHEQQVKRELFNNSEARSEQQVTVKRELQDANSRRQSQSLREFAGDDEYSAPRAADSDYRSHQEARQSALAGGGAEREAERDDRPAGAVVKAEPTDDVIILEHKSTKPPRPFYCVRSKPTDDETDQSASTMKRKGRGTQPDSPRQTRLRF